LTSTNSPRPVRRVFLGPVEIAGYFAAMEEGLAALGVRTMRADLGDHAFRYAASRPPLLARLVLALTRAKQRRAGGSTAARTLGRLESLARILFLLQAALQCDVFVYGFAETITWYSERELRLLRRLGRRLVFVFFGSDSRPPYLDTQVSPAPGEGTGAECARLTAITKARVARVDRYADEIIENPLAGHFHTRSCVNWHVIGLPVRVPPAPDAGARPSTDAARVRVLHCPSHHVTKGTRYVREVMAELEAEGLPIEYVELSGRPHAEILAAIDASDFVIDQLFSDTPLAAFATEAAMRERVPVVAGWGAAEFQAWIAPELRPPGIYCQPTELRDVVTRLVTDRALRERMAGELARFCAEQRTPAAAAAKLLRVVDGTAPDAWRFDPARIGFARGMGPHAVIQAMIQGVLDAGGESALQVDDKPALRAALVDYARALTPADEPTTIGVTR
jgi:hypothetical protein